MATIVKENFVEKRIRSMKKCPDSWEVDYRIHKYFELDLKMCQIKRLNYDFQWGDEKVAVSRFSTAISTPCRILRLNLSLNELTVLEHDSLKPFRFLRELDASLNRINQFLGIEVLKYLHTLNLSHNFIKSLDNLANSDSLVHLNLSMNEIEDISFMPSLSSLEILYLNNNKISTLDGIQNLPRLKELYIKHNQLSSVVPLTSCLHIQILNASDNQIISLLDTTDILTQLKKLQVLNLNGNPLSHDDHYQDAILERTNVMTLDNVTIRALPKHKFPSHSDTSKHIQNIAFLKKAARQAFEERIRDSHARMEESLSYFQKKILDCQRENDEFAEKMHNDLIACLRHLDSLSSSDPQDIDSESVLDTFRTPSPPKHYTSKPKSVRVDYSRVKTTDEVLRHAYGELAGLSGTDHV